MAMTEAQERHLAAAMEKVDKVRGNVAKGDTRTLNTDLEAISVHIRAALIKASEAGPAPTGKAPRTKECIGSYYGLAGISGGSFRTCPECGTLQMVMGERLVAHQRTAHGGGH